MNKASPPLAPHSGRGIKKPPPLRGGLRGIIPILWLAFWLRLHTIANRALWWDEAWSAWISRYDITGILHRSATDVHPPFYMLLLHGWRGLIGDSAWSLRLFSTLFGVLCVVATYKLARAVTPNRWVAVLAPLLVAISRLHITWSQEIRMYTLSTFCATLALVAAVHIWRKLPTLASSWQLFNERLSHPQNPSLIRSRTESIARSEVPPSRQSWHLGQYALLYLVVSVIGLHTHYLFTFVLIAINAAALWILFRREWGAFLRWVGLQVAVGLLWMPWLIYWLKRSRSWSAESPIDLITFFKIQWTVYTVGIPAGVEQFAQWTVPLFIIMIIGILGLMIGKNKRPERVQLIILLVSGAVLPAILLFLLLMPGRSFLYTPPVAPRYFILFVGAYSVLLAWALMEGLPKWVKIFATVHLLIIAVMGKQPSDPEHTPWPQLIGLLAAVFAIIVAVVGLRPYYPNRIEKDIYHSLASTIHAHEGENDAIILFTDFDWPTFDYYVGEGWYGVPSSWVLDEAQVERYLRPIWDEHDAVWLATTPHALQSDPNGLMIAWLDGRAITTTSYQFGDHTLSLYEKTPIDRAFIPPLNPNPLFVYSEHTVDVYESGDQIHLFTVLGNDVDLYTSAHLETAEKRWQTVPIPPQTGLKQSRQHIPITVPPDAPDGEYTLVLTGLYEDGVETGIGFGTVTVRQRKRAIVTLDQVDIDTRLDIEFEDNVTLLGYELGEMDAAGRGVPLTLYWQAREPISQRYKVFTHLLGDVWNDANGNFLWGQQDNEPVNNRRPTLLWRTDEVIVDPYNIPFAENRPNGRYQIEIGLYNPTTGERLLRADGTDHIILTTISLD